MRRRFASRARNRWALAYSRTLIADPRNVVERRFDDLALGLVRNRSRPQMFGPTTLKDQAELVEASRDEILPWEIEIPEDW